MADTVSSLSTALARAAAIIEKLHQASSVDSPSLISLMTAAKVEEGLQAPINSFRSQYAGALSDKRAKELMDPVIMRWGKFISSPGRTPAAILPDMTDYFHDYDVAAQGTLTMDTEPSDGDTITIDSVTYRFKTTMAQAEDILTGDGLAAVKTRLVGVINGSGVTEGVDYYAGTTTPHTTVSAAAFSSDDCVMSARTKGTAGDSIVTTETFSAGTNVFDDTTLGATTAGRDELSVQSRAFTFDASPTAGANNAGTGTVHRLTVGPDGLDIEASLCADTVQVRCTRDAGSGASKWIEDFIIEGLRPAGDRAEYNGSGAGPTPATPVFPRTTHVPNPSFDSLTPTPSSDGDAVTAISGWEIVSGTITAGLGDEGTEIYRDTTRGGGGRSIRSASTAFKLRSRARAFGAGKAYFGAVAVRRESSADGTLTFRLGAHSVSLDLSTLTNDQWYRLVLTIDENCYYENFNEESTDVADGEPAGIRMILERASGTTGAIRLDDVCVEEFTLHDALGYAIDGPGSGASLVAFRKDDTYTFTDTATEAIIQRVIAQAYRYGLPHVSSSPTIAEPSV